MGEDEMTVEIKQTIRGFYEKLQGLKEFL